MSESLSVWDGWAWGCQLVGWLWLREVDADTWQELNEEPLRSLFLKAGGWLPDSFDPQQTSHWVQRLAEEYCRLFVGPRDHRPLVQSVWEQQQFQGDPAAQMLRWWNLLGWEPEVRGVQVPPDHLGLQWLTLGHFCSLYAEAKRRGSSSLGSEKELMQMMATFLCLHLAWFGPVCRWVDQQSTEPFYRKLALMTGRILIGLQNEVRKALQ